MQCTEKRSTAVRWGSIFLVALDQKYLISVFFSVILFAKRWWVEAELRFFVYLVCTAKPAFVDCWDFSVFGKSITYLFSVLLGRSIPSLATKIQ
jgi:hypothetical protein